MIRSKCCNAKLEEVKKSTAPSEPVFGQSYSIYVIYYYCSECGLMYKFKDKSTIKTIGCEKK